MQNPELRRKTEMKYYLCNEIKFLTGMCESAVSPTGGTHMKLSKATNFIESHPHYMIYKERSSSKGNDYVICTPIKFVGNDFNAVDTIQKAKSFGSIDEAFKYLEANRAVIDKDIVFVVDEKLRRKKRSNVLMDAKPIETFAYANMDSSDRIVIPPAVKEEIFNRSKGVCEICGKNLYKQNFQIDHILPLSRGGTNDPANLRAVHCNCNRLKGNFTDGELIKGSGDVVFGQIINNPSSDVAKQLIRAVVRGTIQQCKMSALK